MARPRNPNRNNVSELPLNLRVTAEEKHTLERLRDHQDAELRSGGVLASVSVAGVVRMLIRRASIETFGEFPAPVLQQSISFDASPKPSEPEQQAQAPLPEVNEAAIEANASPSTGMTFIPSLVKALGGNAAHVHAELLDGARAGRWELRPESGMGRLSPEEKALCPQNSDGELLSWVRLPTAPDADAVRKRLSKAIKKGKPWTNQSAFGKDLAQRIDGVKENSAVAWVGRFLGGSGTEAERLALVDAMLREAGQ